MRKDDEGGGGNPTVMLMPPWPSEGVGQEWNAIMDFKNSIPSLGEFAWKAYELVGAGDVPDKWADAIAGDWTHVSEVACAARNLGDYCEAFQSRLAAVVGSARHEWTGNAALAMDAYFTGLGAQVASMKTVLDDIADGVDAMAFGVRHAHDEIENICYSLVDALIGVCVSLGTLAATGWTGLGAGLGAAGLSVSVTFAVVLVNDAVAMLATTIDLVNGFMALFPALLGLVGEIEVVPLPGAGYDNGLLD